MLPFLEGKQRDSTLFEEPSDDMGTEIGNPIRAMAMKAIAQDLLKAMQSQNPESVAKVLDTLCEVCIYEYDKDY